MIEYKLELKSLKINLNDCLTFYAEILRNLDIFIKLLWQMSVKVFRIVLRNDKGVMTYINHLTETMRPY